MVNERYPLAIYRHMEEGKQALEKTRMAKCSGVYALQIDVAEKRADQLEVFLARLAEEIWGLNINTEDNSYKLSFEIRRIEGGCLIYPKIPDNLQANERLKLINDAWQRISSKIRKLEEECGQR